MAFPPPVLPIDRTNALPQQDTHPQDHNNANLAINDLTVEAVRLRDRYAIDDVATFQGVYGMRRFYGAFTTNSAGYLNFTDPTMSGLTGPTGGIQATYFGPSHWTLIPSQATVSDDGFDVALVDAKTGAAIPNMACGCSIILFGDAP